MQKTKARYKALGYEVKFPLWDMQITGTVAKDIIRNDWRICLPEPYLYLSHNNCIPCFKGGKEHFFKVWKHYPDKFEMAAWREEKYEHTVFDDITLRELQAIWERGEQIEFDTEDMRPCMCAF